ncbi:MAG: glycosyltransferase 61 family protein [Methylovulum sp.]|uniref:glycosyltransferase family 61 protein n=1 Tax=Methylovulum sp. TaxID=1916980 RepID=UPI0026390D82|nr:glycosyltransferase 61 family protein [Methylovulum sp.]MDD2725039.1 glycosyltransferase 61 family protein [Methylovulum sp.]MDD5124250.1 glycosyltransferase 61 family protein [Methylovulum sp.]
MTKNNAPDLKAPLLTSSYVSAIRPIRADEKVNYPKGVGSIGGIYDSSDQPHIDSLLIRGAPTLLMQAHENAIEIKRDAATRITDKSIYGGILTNHYGHILLESLARTWYLLDSTGDVYFYHLQHNKKDSTYDDLSGWQQVILSHLVTDPSRIKLINKPLIFDELIVPEAGLVGKNFCAPIHRDALVLLGSKITANCSKDIVADKIWLSRSLLNKGAIAGETKFETALSGEGFLVVHPETLSIAEQIKLFENASVVCGFTGSAFHTLLLAKNKGAKLIHFSRLSHMNNNYHLCAKAAGFDAEYYNYYLKSGESKGIGGSVLQDLTGIWRLLHRKGLVRTRIYKDPTMKEDLKRLDETIRNPRTWS